MGLNQVERLEEKIRKYSRAVKIAIEVIEDGKWDKEKSLIEIDIDEGNGALGTLYDADE